MFTELNRSIGQTLMRRPRKTEVVYIEKDAVVVYDPQKGFIAKRGNESVKIENLLNASQVLDKMLETGKTFSIPKDNIPPLFERADQILDLKPLVKGGRVKGFHGDAVKILTKGEVIFEEITEKNHPLVEFIKRYKIERGV